MATTDEITMAHELLDLPRNFTLEQLKAAYYAKALEAHPDKGGNAEFFRFVTVCFRRLHRKLTGGEGEAGRLHHELKAADQVVIPETANMASFYNGKQFDNDRFQAAYARVRQASVHDKGRADEMSREELAPPPDVKGLTAKNINKHFERHVPKGREIVVHKVPEPLSLASRLQCEELGVDDVEDFSGENRDGSRLHYTDFKVAHTTSRLVDMSAGDRRTGFKSLEALKKHRASPDALQAPPDMQRDLDEYERAREERDQARQARAKAKHASDIAYWDRVRGQITAGAP